MSAYQDLSLQERMLLKFEAEEFLYHEADLLDSRRFDEWLNLLADDIHYWMPLRRTTQAGRGECACGSTKRKGHMIWGAIAHRRSRSISAVSSRAFEKDSVASTPRSRRSEKARLPVKELSLIHI